MTATVSRTVPEPRELRATKKLSTPNGATVVGRGAAREQAIRAAVVELLSEASYDALTMDAIAARAKSSKATIYRRWNSREELVAETLSRELLATAPTIADTGSLRDDILAFADAFSIGDRGMTNIAMVRGLAYAAEHDPDALGILQGAIDSVTAQMWTVVFDRAVHRGELALSPDSTVAREVMAALYCARRAFGGRVDHDFNVSVVDDVLVPIIWHQIDRHSAAR